MDNCKICNIGLIESEKKEGVCVRCLKKYGYSLTEDDASKYRGLIEDALQEKLKKEDALKNEILAEEKKQNAIKEMLISTSENIGGNIIVNTLGIARGSTVRAKHIGRDIMADLKNIVGGEIKGYTEMLSESREQALQRMKEDAVNMGADAVVSVRIATSQIMEGAAEIVCYGTAVTIKKVSQQ